MKKIVSVILAACMLFALIPAASAQDNASDLGENQEMATLREVYKLQEYYEDVVYCFYIDQDSGMGYPFLSHDTEHTKNFRLLGDIWSLRSAEPQQPDGESDITKEQLADYYERIDEVARTCIIYREDLDSLVEFCDYEENINNYYSDELWSDFQAKLDTAKAVNNDKSIKDIRVSDAYWELLFAFNALCTVNTVVGDVDFSGEADIIDATLLQRYAVRMVKFNASQVTVANFSGAGGYEPDITSATLLQRYLVRMNVTINAFYLDKLLQYPADSIGCACNNEYFDLFRTWGDIRGYVRGK